MRNTTLWGPHREKQAETVNQKGKKKQKQSPPQQRITTLSPTRNRGNLRVRHHHCRHQVPPNGELPNPRARALARTRDPRHPTASARPGEHTRASRFSGARTPPCMVAPVHQVPPILRTSREIFIPPFSTSLTKQNHNVLA